MEYRKNRKTPDVMLLTNNQRKMHGVPMWRKKRTRRKDTIHGARQTKRSRHFGSIVTENRRNLCARTNTGGKPQRGMGKPKGI